MTMTVNLGEALEHSVEELVANGRYGSRSEVLREGVRLVEEREQQLARFRRDMEKALAEAEKPGGAISLDESYERWKSRMADRAQASQARLAGTAG